MIADVLPSHSCGLLGRDENTVAVQNSMKRASPVMVSDRRESLIGALRDRLAPDVILSHPDTVGYVHRIDGERHIWFLANLSDEPVELFADFIGMSAPARAWLIDTGAPMPLVANGEQVCLHLDPHASAAVVFAPDLSDAPTILAADAPTQILPLRRWILTVDDQSFFMPEDPISWEMLPALRQYSGTGVYACTFHVDSQIANSSMAALQLTHLSAAARVVLNGEVLSDIWTHPYTVSLAGKLKEGENVLEIAVSSTLVNEMMATPNGGAHVPCPEQLEHWPYYGTVINVHRQARLHNRREATEMTTPLTSGLWGEVSLMF